ncbi:MAG: serine/threonine protein kinase [Phycisphaerales bacterium]|nr:serine/threonine protein kinase [Phycisphaerales bacterium]
MRALFDSACELSQEERPRWLRRACVDDEAMFHELESLLVAHDCAPPQFEEPIFQMNDCPTAPSEDPTRLVGTHLGAYKLTRFVASGGMGHVFAARRADAQYDKTVAVKLIRQDIMNGAMIRRFRRERQALATFDHPNVARLLDAGVSVDGCPYFVMEFVEGTTLTEYCREHDLGIEARLGLFLQVCDAVQCAHENLIIHCDLKPGNILVSDNGACKLLDFSIARLIEPKPSTPGETTAGRHMTPDYASPEQIIGAPVNTRTDIYMLGLVLYELLTDWHPFRTGHRPLYELERIICEVDPEKPSASVARTAQINKSGNRRAARQSRRRLAGDLDAIILKALRRSPDERYRSVEQMAEDIRHHLNGRPITARPQTAMYRLQRFVRRNRGVTIATAIAIVTMFSATVGMSLLYRDAAAERSGAVAARKLAEQQAALADAEARRSATVVEFLQSMMAAADPSNNGREVKVVDVLKAASESGAVEFAEDPALESAVHATIGRTYSGLGLYSEAKTHLIRSLDLESEIAAHSQSDPHAAQRQSERLARAHRELGAIFYETGELDSALRHAREAMELSRSSSGESSAALAQDLNNLASIHRARGELDKAQELLVQAVAIRERVCGPDSVEVAESLTNLSNVVRMRGDAAGAEAYCRRVISIRRAKLSENDPAIAQSLDNLGVVLAQLSRFDEAIQLVRQATSIYRKVHPEGHPDLATNLLNLGSLLCMGGNDIEALECFTEALDLRKQYFETESLPVLTMQMVLGECLIRLQRFDDAESTLLAAEKTAQSPRVGSTLLARIRSDLTILADARSSHEKAAESRERKSQSP